MLQVVVPKLVREYKLRVVSSMMNKIENQMKVASDDFDRSMELMTSYQKMTEIKKILSKQLDRTVNPNK